MECGFLASNRQSDSNPQISITSRKKHGLQHHPAFVLDVDAMVQGYVPFLHSLADQRASLPGWLAKNSVTMTAKA